MKQRQSDQPPAPPGEEPQPLAVLRLHWKKFFFGTAAAVLLIWGLAVLGDSVIGHAKHWVTALASYERLPVRIEAQVTFVREEVPLPGAAGGVAVTLTEPGTRVGAGQPYALVCRDSRGAEALSRRRVLEQRLRWLEDAEEAKSYQALNAEQLGRQVDECFMGFLKLLDSGDCTGLAAQQELFLHRAITLEAALGRPVDFSGELAETRRQLAALAAQTEAAGITQLDAPASGDYYPAADGLERALTPAALMKVNSPEDLQALRELAPAEDGVMGKLVTGFRWYMAAALPGGPAQQLEEGAKYRVMFPQESAREFTMKVEKIRRGGEESVVLFSCDEKDDTVQRLRGAKAEIILDVADGLAIPSAALRFLEKGEGQARRRYNAVYIVRAGKLELREVEVLYQDSARAVVAWGRQNEAQAVEGDRITVQGKILSVTRPAENRLLLIGQDLVLTAETDVKPLEPDGPASVVTARRRLFSETVITGESLGFERKGGSLVLTGEGIAYREQRGPGLKIYDTVLVSGKVDAK
ncbi:MAG: hypothetical protein FWF60_01805 [Oscillospiraceae bacterium]|nr:hypothetical protein [Oscillospiraceae bacterium]